MDIASLVEFFQTINVYTTKFATWFLSELRDYDLTRILESIAALMAIGFTFWRTWRAIIQKPAKLILKYLEKREGEISEYKKDLIAGITQYSIENKISPATELTYVDIDGHIMKANKLFLKGQRPKAKEILNGLADHLSEKEQIANGLVEETRQNSAMTQTLIGVMAYHEEDYPQTTIALTKALELNPDDLEAKKYLGLNELTAKKYPVAADRFSSVVNQAANDPILLADALRLLGYAYLHGDGQGNQQGAVDAIREAARIEDTLGDSLAIARTYELLGDALSNRGNTVQARDRYELCAGSYQRMGETSNASRAHKKYDLLIGNGANVTDHTMEDLYVPIKDLLLLSFRSEDARSAA